MRAVISEGAHSIRIMGSGVLDLCYVAAGRLDVVYAGVAGDRIPRIPHHLLPRNHPRRVTHQRTLTTTSLLSLLNPFLIPISSAGEGWKPWDYAAGTLILTEAGGCLSSASCPHIQAGYNAKFDLLSKSIVATASMPLQQEVVRLLANKVST
jgi:Inositol monophosphatase family